MRPVDKGTAPSKVYRQYQDAEADLEKRLGAYCSYCEFPIKHVPEVEHKEAKSRGGELLDWNNMLLTCKYCNTRKSTIVGKGDKDKYIWPDEDDTFHAFTYHNGIPRLNEDYLNRKGIRMKEKTQNLYNLLKLCNRPTDPKEKDRRFFMRNEALNCALNSLEGWENMETDHDKESFLKQTVLLALSCGFFSVWMEVFKEHPEVGKELISAFPGTKEQFCKMIADA